MPGLMQHALALAHQEPDDRDELLELGNPGAYCKGKRMRRGAEAEIRAAHRAIAGQ